jgi:preprotein translocase subunit SecF
VINSGDVQVSVDSTGAILARMPDLGEDEHQDLVSAVSEAYPGLQELSFQSIGPSIGAALRNKALVALILVLVGISFYIAFAFRKVYQPVSSWKYGFITLLTLAHDVAIPAGVMAVLGRYLGVEIDTNFLVALLVVMGFSVHDTIVVFDRIRENLLKERLKDGFEAIVNRSVNQTLARSINTSVTLILVLIALYAIGPATLNYFMLTLLIGVTMGIYSSIFVASPLLIVWQGWTGKSRPQGRH